ISRRGFHLVDSSCFGIEIISNSMLLIQRWKGDPDLPEGFPFHTLAVFKNPITQVLNPLAKLVIPEQVPQVVGGKPVHPRLENEVDFATYAVVWADAIGPDAKVHAVDNEVSLPDPDGSREIFGLLVANVALLFVGDDPNILHKRQVLRLLIFVLNLSLAYDSINSDCGVVSQI